MRLSVILPAFNEERYLPNTLQAIEEAARGFAGRSTENAVEVLVVDNASTDGTAAVAREHGCRVVFEPEHNIGKVRNAGAREASGEVLVFIDADTVVPAELFDLIAARMADPNCDGGAVDTLHLPSKRVVRAYLALWRVVGRLSEMAQGAAQFWRKTAFQAIGGYDESVFMGEDVEFYWKMTRAAKRGGRSVAFIDEARVIPSPRRFDQWPLWKTFLWTNPGFILLFRKTRKAWPGWYRDRPH